MTGSSSLTARRVAALLAEEERWSREDLAWFERIEAVRRALMASDEPLAPFAAPWMHRSTELQSVLANIAPDDAACDFEVRMTVAQACRGSKSVRACRFLYRLTRALRPSLVVEIGTNVGISGLYLAAALAPDPSARLITLEGSLPKVAIAHRNFAALGLDNVQIEAGDFFETLGPILERHRPIDLAFIDGFHDGAATIEFFERLRAAVDREAVFVFDDIEWSAGMRSAWTAIVRDEGIETWSTVEKMGICVVLRRL